MLIGYFDASATKGELFTLAGLVAPKVRWERFTVRWLDAMARGGAAGKTLHMRCILHGAKGSSPDEDFTGWTEDHRAALFKRLVPVVRSHVAFMVSCSIPIPDFNELLGTFGTARREKLSIYTICLQACLENTAQRVRLSASNPLSVVLEQEDQAIEADAERQFYQLKRTKPAWGDKMGRIAEMARKGNPPLQAADMVAHEANRFFLDQRIRRNGRPPRKLFDELFDPNRCKFGMIGRRALTEHRKRYQSWMDELPDTSPALVDAMNETYQEAEREMQRERSRRAAERKTGKG